MLHNRVLMLHFFHYLDTGGYVDCGKNSTGYFRAWQRGSLPHTSYFGVASPCG